MPISPSHLLDFAKVLAANANDPKLPPHIREAATRSINRSMYYCAFHTALDWAIKRGYKKRPFVGTHESLWQWYEADPNTIDIATTGKALKAKRVDADYKLEKTPDLASDVLEEGGEFLDLFTAELERMTTSGEPLKRTIPWPPPKAPRVKKP